MLYDVERLALAAGGGELDRPHIPRNFQSRLVQHSAPLSDPHQRRTHRQADLLRLRPDRIRDALDMGAEELPARRLLSGELRSLIEQPVTAIAAYGVVAPDPLVGKLGHE